MGWRRFLHRKEWDEERARELASYLEFETAENLDRGMTPQQAREAACRKLGNRTQIREEIYRMNSIGWLETLRQDLHFALRMLRKGPGFTAVAVLSLALGIGANSAVFSLIHAVMLRPLPFPEPERLLRVGQGEELSDVSVPQLEFWKEHTPAFETAAGYRGNGDRSLTSGAAQRWIRTSAVTADFFRTLGIAPVLGREFHPEETRRRGPLAVVIGDGLWRSEFGGDPSILGRTVRIDDVPHTVVGVLPPGFWFPQSGEAFVPLQPTGSPSDRGTNTQMIARLKAGTTLAAARAEMPAIAEAYRRADPEALANARDTLALGSFQSWLAGDIRLKLLALFGAVGLLLLIACFNLASLLLARLATRRKEIAMRLALGCGRVRLIRQFAIENLLLALAGGLAGLLGAQALLRSVISFVPFELNTAAPVQVDLAVLGFGLAVACLTGLSLGLLPVLTASRLDLVEALRSGGRTAGSRVQQRGRSLLVVSQVALSVTLLVSAALLIQSLYRLHQEKLGFLPQELTTFRTPMPAERRRDAAAMWRFQAALLEKLQSLPGVRRVAAINLLPLTGTSNFPTQREGHPENSIGGMEIRGVTPDYYEAMGIPLRRGREFTASDNASAPPVMMINETLAQRWWGAGGNPVGDRVVIGRFQGRDFGTPMPREVVGVVGDTKTRALQEPPRPTVFVPSAQMPELMGGVDWILNARSSAALAAEIRRAVAAVDSHQRVIKIQALEEVVNATTANSRFDAWLFGALAALALLLTSVGVYGILSFSVARRTNEIGTRMALGASRGAVLALVLKQGLALVAIGLLLGLAGAVAATRSLTTLLYAVRPTDPASFAGVAGLLLAVGLAASYLPARRATRIDPMTALRED